MSICPLCELTHCGVLVSSTSTSKLIKSPHSSLQDVNVYETPVSNPDCNQQHLFLKPAGFFSFMLHIHSLRVKYHENWINLHEKKKAASSPCQRMLQLYFSHVVICVTIDGHKQENCAPYCLRHPGQEGRLVKNLFLWQLEGPRGLSALIQSDWELIPTCKMQI